MPQTRPSEMETELGRRDVLTMGGLELDMVGNWPLEDTLLAGGQHLEASQAAAEAGGPLGQDNIQSSELVMDPVGSPVSTNSGWMVVE